MKTAILALSAAVLSALTPLASGEIGIISPEEAKKLIENPNVAERPIVLDTRGGYKDYFRGASADRTSHQLRHTARHR